MAFPLGDVTDRIPDDDPEENIPPPDMMHYFRVFVTRRKMMYPTVKEISVYLIKAVNSKQAYDIAKETIEEKEHPGRFHNATLWVEEVELPHYNQAVQIWKSEMNT